MKFTFILLTEQTCFEDMEGASGDRQQECWFGGKGCHEYYRARWRVGVGQIAAKVG